MKYIFPFFLVIEIALSQRYAIGDTVNDFTMEVCANEDVDTLYFYDFNGEKNGGINKVIWINFFTSW